MLKTVEKEKRVCLCRKCSGTGQYRPGILGTRVEVCPQCEGSGRVLVGCLMTLSIEAYHPLPAP